MHRYFEINGSGHNIRCKLYYRDLKDIRRVVIACHGFGSSKENTASDKLAERMTSKYKGCALVTFDWPCHGDDVKKVLRLDDCTAYLRLVIDYVREKYRTEELYGYGTSFGGYLMLKYIAEQGSPFRKIALRCPAVNMYEALTQTIMESGELEKLQKGKDISVGFDRKIPMNPAFLEELGQKDIRTWDFLDWAEDILIMHGTKDEVIPFEEGRAFAENNLIEFAAIQGTDHRFRAPGSMEQAVKLILAHFEL